MIMRTFNEVDLDENGFIDVDEFQQALDRLGLTPKDTESLFNSIDKKSEENGISLEEFKNWVKGGRKDFASEVARMLVTGKTYEFAYGFLRDTAYRNMLFQQRARIHRFATSYYARNMNEMWHSARCYDPVLQEIAMRHNELSEDCRIKSRDSYWHERAYDVFQSKPELSGQNTNKVAS